MKSYCVIVASRVDEMLLRHMEFLARVSLPFLIKMVQKAIQAGRAGRPFSG